MPAQVGLKLFLFCTYKRELLRPFRNLPRQGGLLLERKHHPRCPKYFWPLDFRLDGLDLLKRLPSEVASRPASHLIFGFSSASLTSDPNPVKRIYTRLLLLYPDYSLLFLSLTVRFSLSTDAVTGDGADSVGRWWRQRPPPLHPRRPLPPFSHVVPSSSSLPVSLLAASPAAVTPTAAAARERGGASPTTIPPA